MADEAFVIIMQKYLSDGSKEHMKQTIYLFTTHKQYTVHRTKRSKSDICLCLEFIRPTDAQIEF